MFERDRLPLLQRVRHRTRRTVLGASIFNRRGQLIDWYREGVKALLPLQTSREVGRPGGDHRWRPGPGDELFAVVSREGQDAGADPQDGSRRQRPRLCGGWNLHHNDVRNLTAFCSANVFKKDNRPVPLTWQIFDAARQARAEGHCTDVILQDMLQAPVCFINGLDAPKFSDGEKCCSKRYVEQGGFIFAEASCGRHASTRASAPCVRSCSPTGTCCRCRLDIRSGTRRFRSSRAASTLQGSTSGARPAWPTPRGYLLALGIEQAPAYPRTKLAFQLGANVIAYATGLETPEDKLAKKRSCTRTNQRSSGISCRWRK